jgi:CBS domain-containing protein
MKLNCGDVTRTSRQRRVTREVVVVEKQSLLTPVGDLMSEPAVAADPLSIVGRTLELAEQRGVSHLPVAWEDGEIIGILCTCDISYAQEHELVIQYMSLPVITVRERDTLFRAGELMRQNDVGCLPVVDDEGRLCGMVTEGDLLRAGVLDHAPPTCMACGSHHHVRGGRAHKSQPEGQALCLRCREAGARRTG